jgi:hypothetical protein
LNQRQRESVVTHRAAAPKIFARSVSAGQIAELLHGSGLCAGVHLSTREPTAKAYRATTAGAVAAARKAGVLLHAELSARWPPTAARASSTGARYPAAGHQIEHEYLWYPAHSVRDTGCAKDNPAPF